MSTYREIFANREFRVLFAGNALGVAAGTIQMLALAAWVYGRTGSPLLTVLAYLGGLLPYAVGAMTLLSYADRVPPRGFLAVWDALRAATIVVLAVGALPIWSMIGLVMATGMVQSVAVAVRNAVIVDVLPDGYILGRATLNVSVGAMQIVGFAVGGTLIATLGPDRALLVSAALVALTAALTRAGLRARPAHGSGRAGVAATWRGNRRLLGSPTIRPVLLGMWLPNGLIVGAEAMYVPYAAAAASALFIAAALGMLCGDLVVGRWVPDAWRVRLPNRLHLLLAAPYLLFLAHPPVWLATGAVAVASFGYAGTLGLQQRLITEVGDNLRGQALGLDSNGRMTMQAVAASLVGLVAEVTGAAGAMAVAAVASLGVTIVLWPALQGPGTARLMTLPRGHQASGGGP